jgi:intracellular sulfur oxidation DsrE/DsrF family protein
MSHSPVGRRGFFGGLSAAVGFALTLPRSLWAGAPGDAPPDSLSMLAPDERWLAGLSGSRRQFFDVGVLADGKPLARVWNYYDAYGDVYGARDTDLATLFGAHGSAFALTLRDELWEKYPIGTIRDVADPVTAKPARRNPFAKTASITNTKRDASVEYLQRRGVRFLACERSLRNLADELATATGTPAAAIRDELRAGLLPGVILVPAMVVASNRAQVSGFTYVYIGG